jgi:hypothetical protein
MVLACRFVGHDSFPKSFGFLKQGGEHAWRALDVTWTDDGAWFQWGLTARLPIGAAEVMSRAA